MIQPIQQAPTSLDDNGVVLVVELFHYWLLEVHVLE